MRIAELNGIKSLFFTVRDVAQTLGVSDASARLSCHRYVKAGYLVRPERNVYVLAERWRHAGTGDFFQLANRLQVPSYISFGTALGFYEISTQIRRNFYESAAQTRTKTIKAGGVEFHYLKLQAGLYRDFVKRDGFFIAVPEKAFLDCLYLMSLRRYGLDLSSVDFGKLDLKRLKRAAALFPHSTKSLLEKICKI